MLPMCPRWMAGCFDREPLHVVALNACTPRMHMPQINRLFRKYALSTMRQQSLRAIMRPGYGGSNRAMVAGPSGSAALNLEK